MSRPTKIAWAALMAVVVLGVAVLVDREPAPAPADTAVAADRVVRPDSHRLTSPEHERARFVEFLDFECDLTDALHRAAAG